MEEDFNDDDIATLLQKQQQEQAMQQQVAQATPSQRQLLAQLYKKQEQSDIDRKDILRQQLEAQLENQPTNVDWTPLAAQLQDMYGGRAPVAAAQSNFTAGEESQERTTKLFDSLTAPQKGGLGAKETLGNEDRNVRFASAQSARFEKEIRDKKDKLDKDITDTVAGFGAVESAFTPDTNGNIDLKKIMSGLSNYARSIGSEKGALNEGDVQRAAYIRDYLTMFEGLKMRFRGKATIPQAEMQPYLDRLIAAKEDQRERLNDRTSALRASFADAPSTAQFFETPDSYGSKAFAKTQSILDKGSYINPLLRPKKAQPKISEGKPQTATKAADAMTPEQADEMLKALGH